MTLPPTGEGWRARIDSWRDVFRGPYTLLAVLVCMIVVGGNTLAHAASEAPATSELINGVAAVVCALAAIIEATRGGQARERLADHEARLRVLESK